MLNGKLVDEETSLVGASDRVFRYGDGCFETMRVYAWKPLFFDAHWQRLQRTAKFLHIDIPNTLTAASLQKHIEELCKANVLASARVRLQLYREGEGTYRPKTDTGHWVMQCSPLPTDNYVLNRAGLTVGICSQYPVPLPPIGNHKTLNALPYVLASIHAREKKWNDALLLNVDGHITEATSSNLFLIKGKEMLTPDLSHGGLPGIIRSKLMELARADGYQVNVTNITDREMQWADECLLTNSIHGIQWVLAYGQKRYFHRHAESFTKALNRLTGIS